MAEHDESYKLLFSFPEMVADLLRGFVHEDWVAHVDLSTLEQVSGDYVSDDLRDREDDVVWRVRWRDGWLYVYILLEFQSGIERFMAVRVMTYEGLLYQDLIRQGQLTDAGLLPPVFPVVLYNGDPRWTAPREVADLVAQVPGGLAAYRPQLRYLLLAKNDFGGLQVAALATTRNLVAALFGLENSRSPEDLGRVLDVLRDWLGTPASSELRRAFTVWLRRVLLPRRVPNVNLPELRDLGEVQAMIAENEIDWTRTWREEGMREGMHLGQAAVLTRLLERKFGPLPEEHHQRVTAADNERLLEWADRVLDARRIEDVFGQPQ